MTNLVRQCGSVWCGVALLRSPGGFTPPSRDWRSSYGEPFPRATGRLDSSLRTDILDPFVLWGATVLATYGRCSLKEEGA
jgi:hypothetical protein